MSKFNNQISDYAVIRRRIPLTHIDACKSSVTNMDQIQVKIRNCFKLEGLFEVAGEAPTYIAKLCKTDDERLYGVNVKVGDYIMTINERNVSRASAKSVKKIIRSSNVLCMTLCRPDATATRKPVTTHVISETTQQTTTTKHHHHSMSHKFNSLLTSLFSRPRKTTSLIDSCIGAQHLQKQIEPQIDNESIDQGYCSSIPRTNSIPSTESLVSSSSATTSSSSLAPSDLPQPRPLNIQVAKFRAECDYFLTQIQQAIDIYVRPSVVLNILSIRECLGLYQNIEKLIPVTRFMQNVLNSSNEAETLPNSELLQIVFDSFKTYLTGLPSAIKLLGELSESNSDFVEFVESRNDSCEFKITDLLFMPLNFVQLMIEFLRNIQTTSTDTNKTRFGELIRDLYECSMMIHKELEAIFAPEETSQIDEEVISQLSLSSYESSAVSLSECGLEKVAVKVLREGYDSWAEAYLWINKMKLEFVEGELGVQSINNLVKVRASRNACLIYLKLGGTGHWPEQSMSIKFESECLRNYLYEKMVNKFF